MDTKLPDLSLLVTLETLLAERNVTKAAARLNLSQPAVSAQLNRLRDMFADPLLLPAQRGMIPTTTALDLLEPLRAALDQVRGVLAMHRHFDPASEEMTIGIACTDYLQAILVLPLVLALKGMAPGIRVAVHNLDPARLETQLSGGDVDLALMTPPAGASTLRSRHLFDERYLLIGRLGNPALHPGLTLEEFADLEHVIVSPGGGDFTTPVDTALAALGLRRRVVLSAASFLFVPEIVARSDVVALTPRRLVIGRDRGFAIVEPPLAVEGFAVAMLWHERSHHHGGHRWLRERLIELVGQEGNGRD